MLSRVAADGVYTSEHACPEAGAARQPSSSMMVKDGMNLRSVDLS